MMRFVLPAIVLSLGLHAGLLAWAGVPDAVVHGAESRVSSTVIVFDAQPAPSASASAGAEEVAEQQPVEADDLPAETLPDKEPAKVQPVDLVEDAETEQAAPEPEPVVEALVEETQQVVEPQQLEQSEPVTEPVPAQPVATRPFVPIPRNKPEVSADFAQNQITSEKLSLQKSKAKPRKRPAKKAGSGRANKTPTKKLASSGTGRKKIQRREGSAGRSGGASAGEKAAYARRVLSHIQRYKSFPSGARAGKVELKVRISASGALISALVRRRSGHRILDNAALATARRAAPYPKPPGSRNFSFTVSLKYVR